jgi:hypothetical protein
MFSGKDFMENEMNFEGLDGLDNFDELSNLTDYSEFGEIDEFDDELEAFEATEFDLDEIEPVAVRTAILAKNNLVALLCIKTAEEGGAICRVDPREANPAVQVYDDAQKALEWFNKSLRTSKKNGWQIAYDGMPMYG